MSLVHVDGEDLGRTSGIGRRRVAARAEGGQDYRARRRAIISAAAAVFREKGYEAATLNDVAERVGFDRASLYYYVGGKEELLHETVREGVEANLEEVERILELDLPPEDKLRLMVTRLLSSYEEYYPHMFVYIQEDMSKVASEHSEWAREMTRATRRWESATLSLIREAMERGGFRDDVRARIAANALFGMINWTHRWFKPDRRLGADELVEGFWTIFVRGMRRSASDERPRPARDAADQIGAA